jgi:hypothetical protein
VVTECFFIVMMGKIYGRSLIEHYTSLVCFLGTFISGRQSMLGMNAGRGYEFMVSMFMLSMMLFLGFVYPECVG